MDCVSLRIKGISFYRRFKKRIEVKGLVYWPAPLNFYATRKLITLKTAINQIAGEVVVIFPVNILIKA